MFSRLMAAGAGKLLLLMEIMVRQLGFVVLGCDNMDMSRSLKANCSPIVPF